MTAVRGTWFVETTKPKEETDEFLRAYSPWRVAVDFSNGAKSSDHPKFEPFNPRPLNKLEIIRQHVPGEMLKGRVLDVGHNAGYNCIDLAGKGATAVGIDVVPRHQAVARWIAEAAGANASFHIASAETYCEPGSFDCVLHLGTLYHLPNPVLSLETAARNLKPGGWLALETTAYIGPGAENHLNKWVYGFGGDKSNTWALAKPTLVQMLEVVGFESIRLIHEMQPKVSGADLSRVLYTAIKRSSAR